MSGDTDNPIRRGGRKVAERLGNRGAQSQEAQEAQKEWERTVEARLNRMRTRIRDLEDEVQENRLLNMRLAELTDIVQELLVPVAQRDQDRLAELLERYGASLQGRPSPPEEEQQGARAGVTPAGDGQE